MPDQSLRLPIDVPIDDAPQRARRLPDSPVVQSALWAAWGDALGFPMEMGRSPREPQRSFGKREVSEPVKWRRRVGGRFGPDIDLPAGTYSDDTQLRLAVGRCIRSGGRFDVEAFSKIELPVFLSYELGAGRATRRAAHGLAKRATRWNSNFYDHDVRYVAGGGNGVAMRIQPHVWAARDHRAEAYLPGLLRDAVCTHGHPRGILGAAWHALALGTALRDREVPAPRAWIEMARSLGHISSRVQSDETLAERWLPRWSQAAGEPFADACRRTVVECEDLAELAATAATGNGELAGRYAELAAQVGGLHPETRGSGTVSAILALWLAWAGRDDALGALRVAANLRGSDTDTVATMAGAILGAVADARPPGRLQDLEFLAAEATRLDELRKGVQVEDYPHPDPLRWQPPVTLSDAVGLNEAGEVVIAGLGPATAVGEPFPSKGKDAVVWQWLRMRSGQTVLAKRRAELEQLEPTSLPLRRLPAPAAVPKRTDSASIPTTAPSDGATAETTKPFPSTVEDALAAVIEGDFDHVAIGRLVMQLGHQEHGEEKAGIFAALVVRAQREQRQASRRPPHVYRAYGRG